MPLHPIDKKLMDFDWHVVSCDGHDVDAIKVVLSEAQETKGQPTMIILNTIKGKGVSFMENDASWHGKAPNAEELERALDDRLRRSLSGIVSEFLLHHLAARPVFIDRYDGGKRPV